MPPEDEENQSQEGDRRLGDTLAFPLLTGNIIAVSTEDLEGDLTIGSTVSRDGQPLGIVHRAPREGVVNIYLQDNHPAPAPVDITATNVSWGDQVTNWTDIVTEGGSEVDSMRQQLGQQADEIQDLKATVRSLMAAVVSGNPNRLLRSPNLMQALQAGKDVTLRLLPSGGIDVRIPPDPEDPSPTVWDHLHED